MVSGRRGSGPDAKAEGYVQIKAYVKPEEAAAFKERCLRESVSVSGRLNDFIKGETDKKSPVDAVETRKRRRKAVGVLMDKLGAIISAETAYRDNIPENLRNSRVYEASEQTVEILEEALGLLGDAY